MSEVGKAFVIPVSSVAYTERDDFLDRCAIAAMQAMISSRDHSDDSLIAFNAYQQAEKMVEERDNRMKGT